MDHLVPSPPLLPPEFTITSPSVHQEYKDFPVESTNLTLVEAIQSGNLLRVEELLRSSDVVNQNTLHGTPLSIAVRSANLNMVMLIASQTRCNINNRDYDGETAISLALRKNLEEVAMFLISKGCSLNQLDPVSGLPPLSVAIQSMNEQLISAILERCDVDQKDRENQTPLCHAALLPEPEYNEPKRRIMTTLLKAGADANCRLGPPFTGSLLHKVILEKCHVALETLLHFGKETAQSLPSNRKRVNVNKPTAVEKNTPLHIAVAVHDERLIEMLLISGAKPNVSNVFRDTPLTKALKDTLYDMRSVVKLLLEHEADPNYEAPKALGPQRKGETRPLFAAIVNGSREYVELLLKYGADLCLPNYKGHCAIMPCLNNGLSIGLLRFVVERMGGKFDISDWMYLQAAFPWHSHLQFLIDRGLDVNAKDLKGCRILHTNAIKLYPASLEIALRNGLDPNSLTGTGANALTMVAGLPEYWPAIKILVKYGADINARDPEDGLTPLQRAFLTEYECEDDIVPGSSQFRYFANCGAKLTDNLSAWRNAVVADRCSYIYSEDGSEGHSSSSSDDSTADVRRRLLEELETIFSPLPLTMLCRISIRSMIIVTQSTAEIESCIQKLPLPLTLKQFLAFDNVPTDVLLR